MALSLTELQAVTDDFWIKSPVDIYFQDNVLLYKLMGKADLNDYFAKGSEIVDGGMYIRTIVEYDKGNVGSYGNQTDIPLTKKEIFNAPRFRWAAYYASNTIDFDDQVQNSGSAAMVDLAFGRLRNIQKTIRDKMGTDIYASAADGDSFLGLGDLFNDTTSTAYATIAEDDMSTWKANLDSTSEAISFAVLQEMRRTPAIGQNKSDKPNLYITTDALKDGFERTLQTQARYADVDLVNAGFDNVLFGGAPVVADDKQTSGYCDGLNLNYLKIKTHKKYNFTKPVWEHKVGQPDALTANVRWAGQLVCSHRKAHVRHTGLTEPS